MTKHSTLAKIEAEIAHLQARARAIREEEVKGVIGRIKEAIAHYGLTAEDLGLVPRRGGRKAGASGGTSKSSKPTGKKTTPKVKFSDGTNTWSGHGRRPAWYIAALEAGKTPEDLTVG